MIIILITHVLQTIRPCDCPPGSCEACDKYVDQLDDVLKHSMPKEKCGAFIAEVIQVWV